MPVTLFYHKLMESIERAIILKINVRKGKKFVIDILSGGSLRPGLNTKLPFKILFILG